MQHLAVRLSVALVTFFIGISTSYITNLRPAAHFSTVSDSEAAQEVLAVEREYIRAHTERDVAALKSILADDFTIGPAMLMGRARTKASRLALLASPNFTFVSIDTRDVKVQVDGDEAVVTGQAVARSRYRDRDFTSPEYDFVRSYQRRQGRWQVVSVQIILAGR